MKGSLFYTVMLTMTIGVGWAIWQYRTTSIPVTDIDTMINVPADETERAKNLFKMDKYEVTNGQFWRFDNEHEFDKEFIDYPVTMVDWFEASAYAVRVGKRLPSRSEWEHASRITPENSLMPWEHILRKPLPLAENGMLTVRVGKYWRDQTPIGIFDMAGNAWEWTSDTLRLADGTLAAIVKGGFEFKDNLLHANGLAVVDTMPVHTRLPYLGFRCIKNN